MSQPLISIIITTYIEASKPYLDACIASIKNLNYPPECLDVVLVGRVGYMPEYEGVRTVAPLMLSFGCAEGVNFGISKSLPESKYIFTINDDVILTKDCLNALVAVAADNDIILNPTSNCDNGIKYIITFGFMKDGREHRIESPSYKYDDLAPFLPELMNAESYYGPGVMLTDSLFFYATLIPRKVWDKVGQFDEIFKTGQDDIDYSIRAQKKGISMGICMNSVVWHFGGASAAHTMTDPVRVRNMQYFKHKWGYYPFHMELDLPPLDLRELDFIGE